MIVGVTQKIATKEGVVIITIEGSHHRLVHAMTDAAAMMMMKTMMVALVDQVLLLLQTRTSQIRVMQKVKVGVLGRPELIVIWISHLQSQRTRRDDTSHQEGAHLDGTPLGATLNEILLGEVHLEGVHLERVRLEGVRLEGVRRNGVHRNGVHLDVSLKEEIKRGKTSQGHGQPPQNQLTHKARRKKKHRLKRRDHLSHHQES